MLNDNMLAADFIILGPIPSNPIALLESKAIIEGGDIRNFEKISFGTLSFTKFAKQSGSKRSRLSEIHVD